MQDDVRVGPPEVLISVDFTSAGAEEGQYEVTFRLENNRDNEVQVQESWLPHGQFRAERELYRPAILLNARGQRLLTRQVAYKPASPGAVENAFFILQVVFGKSLWRIFARLRVEAGAGNKIEPIVERVTVNPVVASTEQVEEVNGA